MSTTISYSKRPALSDVPGDKRCAVEQPYTVNIPHILDSIDFDFKGCETGYLTHGLHPYPAKYIPQIPSTLIREYSSAGQTVADVFCGSGTTLIEALLNGRNAIGVDANPLAALISIGKTTRIKPEEAESLRRIVEKAEALGRSLSSAERVRLWTLEPFKSNADRPNVDAISFWFEPHVVEEIAEILHWCVNSGGLTENARPVALVALSSIIIAVSKQDSDTRYVRRKKSIVPGDTFLRFARALRSAVEAIEQFTKLVPASLTREVHACNVLECPDVGAFDLMVCSPPYPNAYSYHLYHMTRMVWLGMDQPRFKLQEIGSHRKYSSKGRNGATVETFRDEMARVLRWLKAHLKRGGVACFVIGDSTIRGERINNAQLISDVAALLGYKEEDRIVRRLEPTKKAFNPAIGKIKQETVLVLQNEG